MPTTRVQTDAAPNAIGPYSQAILQVHSGGSTLWTAGQIPLDPVSMELVQGDITAQTDRVMKNLGAVLAAAGMTFADAVKTTVFIIDFADFAAMNEVYGRCFTEGAPPARTTVQVAALPRGARIEIELVAVKGAPPAVGARRAEASARTRQAPKAAVRSSARKPAAKAAARKQRRR